MIGILLILIGIAGAAYLTGRNDKAIKDKLNENDQINTYNKKLIELQNKKADIIAQSILNRSTHNIISLLKQAHDKGGSTDKADTTH